jgi:3-polyprenyl-4-hydroxybenzoate decarboxylase
MSKHLKVKTLKHGDVKYYINNRMSLIKDLLFKEEQNQVDYLNSKEKEKAFLSQGKIEAFQKSLTFFNDLETYIERYSCSEYDELDSCNLNKIL